MTDEIYMQRCLQLARLGGGAVAPNPMVGALLLHEGRIIGEGYHRQYGGPHAEVNCFASVKPEDRLLIPKSTLYVSLEPCAHFGKTPPCANRIIAEGVQQVVVGCRDPFPLVKGKGIEKLEAAGVRVKLGVMEEACEEINRRFFHFHRQHRPFVLLKWAETLDKKIAGSGPHRLMISGPMTNRLVHRWRSENAAILVGTHTALVDNPQLNTRHWPGANPLRLVIDLGLKLPQHLKLFSDGPATIVFNLHQHNLPLKAQGMQLENKVYYYQVTENVSLVHQVLNGLYQLQVQSVMVEGGAQLLQSFIDEDLWDEAVVITNTALLAGEGLSAPVLNHQKLKTTETLGTDFICYYQHKNFS